MSQGINAAQILETAEAELFEWLSEGRSWTNLHYTIEDGDRQRTQVRITEHDAAHVDLLTKRVIAARVLTEGAKS
jgi:hypothetical protein